MMVLQRIKEELDSYKEGNVEVTEGYTFSAFKLIRRVLLYKNQIFTTGKRDSQGNYKYWFDVISPRVDAEVKNVDFDTKDIVLMSDAAEDAGKLLIANARLKEYLRETGQAAKLNEAVERGTEWGNVVWKQIKGGYKLMELDKFMVLNQTAEALEDSDVIEKEIMTPIDIRKKAEVWENVDKLIAAGKKEHNKTAPEFFIYERNGEITTKEFNEAKGSDAGDDKTYVLAKVITGGVQDDDPTEVLFIEEITKKPYKEYHRGKFSGRWLRTGMYEILFDVQTRANEIGNQIARGLEWSSKTIFRSSDRVIAQNILTDLNNGDIIKSKDLQQVQTRMEGFDQLIADWNRLMVLADRLANSSEVVIGESLPSGTPFRLAERLNINANKLFDFLREKLGIVFQDVVEEWIIPGLLKDLRAKDVLKLTADSGYLNRYYEMIVEAWYLRNLLALPPHTPEIAVAIKEAKVQELLQNKEIVVRLEKEMWADFKPRAMVVITGEQVNLNKDLENLRNFATIEADPVRRTALIELAMKKVGMDVDKLPKSEPQQLQPQLQPPQSQEKVALTPAE
ncbi:MAG TPA: hypothetical protein ENI13_01945 [candidate division CPR3 bacterium]|uniref:Phage portal protein n=1 Tax=candidate division CPR3 bacterium TaxID=2268181 RepID=A0A7C1T7H7_UNCC3|nr:hypothetical protein [candidate division CPR3 bacterium]